MIDVKKISNKNFYLGLLILAITPTFLSAQHYIVDLEDTGADELNVAIFGCTDESAENYNLDATIDDGSCDFG